MSMLKSAKESSEMAASVKNDSDVYFVPAFSGLYAPYWNQEARGVICGLTEDTDTRHIVKATLEAVCFQVRDILDAMNLDCGIPLQKLQVDGGMSENNLLMQWQSDFIGIDVIRPAVIETTALGAAMVKLNLCDNFKNFNKINFLQAAGRGVGIWDLDKVGVQLPSKTFKPIATENERDMRYARWKLAVEKSFGWDS